MNLRRAAAYSLFALSTSCSSDPSAPTANNDPVDISNVVYVGGVTDEALEHLLALTPKNDTRHAVIVDSPDLSAPLSKDSPATLQFHPATGATRAPGLRTGPAKWRRPMHELLQLLAPERIAHAHGTPYDGPAYYLELAGADSKPILQVFTPMTSFTPEALDWQHLAEAPQPLTLKITSAIFDANAVSTDGGPFVGGTFSFRIE